MLLETQMPDILHRGKVRDTYGLGGGHLLMVATDRISAFWFERTKDIVPTHFICLADSPEAAQYLEGSSVAEVISPQVARQAMVVQRAERIDIECIVRGYITGSAWSDYRRQGTVSGMDLGPGLVECQPFPEPLFTPTTMACRATWDETANARLLLSRYWAPSGESAKQMKWLGTMSLVRSNQKAEIRFRTSPLSAMPVGNTTSKAEMRSVATISRRPLPSP